MFITATQQKRTSIVFKQHKHKQKHILYYNDEQSVSYFLKYGKYRVLHRIDGPAMIQYFKSGDIKDIRWFVYGDIYTSEELCRQRHGVIIEKKVIYN
jgi:hypothetical protein